jgi:hypothetical protein
MIGGPYFGVPCAALRNRIWPRMRPSEKDLYIALLHESERYHSRQLVRTDADLIRLVGGSSRSLRNARPKLQERGLILYERKSNGYRYTICNPETGRPYPGNPRHVIFYQPAEKFGRKRETETAVQGIPLKFQ